MFFWLQGAERKKGANEDKKQKDKRKAAGIDWREGGIVGRNWNQPEIIEARQRRSREEKNAKVYLHTLT